MFLAECREFPSAPCLARKKTLMTARVSMLLKSSASPTCFRVCFLPGWAKDLSAPLYVFDYMLTCRVCEGLIFTTNNCSFTFYVKRKFEVWVEQQQMGLLSFQPFVNGVQQLPTDNRRNTTVHTNYLQWRLILFHSSLTIMRDFIISISDFLHLFASRFCSYVGRNDAMACG